MLRLIIAGLIVYLLLPESHVPAAKAVATERAEAAEDISTQQILQAGKSIFDDTAGFCDRNPKTCETAQALLVHLKQMMYYTFSTLDGPELPREEQETSTVGNALSNTFSIQKP